MHRLQAIVALLLLFPSANASAACAGRMLTVPPSIPSSIGYVVTWDGPVDPTSFFELQRTSDPFFSETPPVQVHGALFHQFAAQPGLTADTRYYHRVREICAGIPGEYGPVVAAILGAPRDAMSSSFALAIPAETTAPVIQDLLVPGLGETATDDDRFAIVSSAPWLTVFPANGALSAGGTTVQFTVHAQQLPAGESKATLTISRTGAAPAAGITIPVAVSSVTPIRAVPRTPSEGSGTLLIPAVAHADGNNSRFESDVRITNVSSENATFALTFVESGFHMNSSARQTLLPIAPNETKALNDVVRTSFARGLAGDSTIGTLEVRPLQAGQRAIGASRTFNVTPSGTLGQFIPALPIDSFISDINAGALDVISLQQITEGSRYRTNLGFAEGGGVPVGLLIRLYDTSNNLLEQVDFSLGPFGHRQLRLSHSELFYGRTLENGRVEVVTTSPGAKVTAYASVLDNITSDPLLVYPVQAKRIDASRYVIPGIAELTSANNFHSDMRIYNAREGAATVTLHYEPQTGDPTLPPAAVTFAIEPGHVKVIDNAIPTLWNLTATGGAVVATTPGASSLVITARTFSRTPSGGTYGQFIQAVTAEEAIGSGDPAMHVLQMEQSPQFRSNLGLFEVTGQGSALVEISSWTESATTPLSVETLTIEPGELRQISSYLRGRVAEPAYNGRVSVRVIGGSGRVSAYASVIDNRTEDPTFVPGQK